MWVQMHLKTLFHICVFLWVHISHFAHLAVTWLFKKNHLNFQWPGMKPKLTTHIAACWLCVSVQPAASGTQNLESLWQILNPGHAWHLAMFCSFGLQCTWQPQFSFLVTQQSATINQSIDLGCWFTLQPELILVDLLFNELFCGFALQCAWWPHFSFLVTQQSTSLNPWNLAAASHFNQIQHLLMCLEQN